MSEDRQQCSDDWEDELSESLKKKEDYPGAIKTKKEEKKYSVIHYPEDTVNHPKHYTFGKYEVIDVLEDWKLDFCLGNTIKYIARAKHKGHELEDLKKAQWYLNRKISQLEKEK